MTAREHHQLLVTLIYAALATAVAEMAAGAAVWLTVPRSNVVFLAVWAVLSVASVWPGARVCAAAGRRWDRANPDPPPSGGTPTDGPAGPSPERIHP